MSVLSIRYDIQQGLKKMYRVEHSLSSISTELRIKGREVDGAKSKGSCWGAGGFNGFGGRKSHSLFLPLPLRLWI